jgi:hypothetical protein
MTQTRTLNVEKQELVARADELEAPLPGQPSEKPMSPCALAVAGTAAEQLALSADNMRIYLDVAQRERQRLAQSLRNAAKAYGDVDNDAEAALNTGNGSVSPVTAGLVDGGLDPVTLTDTQLAAPGSDELYKEVKQAAREIETGDQGASFDRFANEWIAHQRALLEAAYRFRPFQHWDGEAAAAVEAAFDAHRSWLYQMADLCGTMIRQAQGVTSVHRWAIPEHPSLSYLLTLDDYVKAAQEAGADTYVRSLLELYAKHQAKSEEVGAEYAKKAAIPPVNPPKPPAAFRIAEPQPSSPDPEPQPGPEPDWSLDEFPSVPTGGMPTGGMPTGGDGATLTDALPGAPSLPTGSGVKPASFGGGGIGGGVPPMSDLIHRPNYREWTFAPAPASPAAAGPGRGIPGVGGAMGGGMGMAPMGQGGQPQGGGKGKRAQHPDESLYTEERPWTEPIIGNRRVKE